MNLELKDYEITINGFISCCHCKCNHCLLCSGDEKIKQVPFEKLKQLALKFDGFKEQFGINTILSPYNSCEFPELLDTMEINKKLSFYHGYQNLNGSKIRKGIELKEWVSYLKNCGVTNANLSWFGEKEFHDKFANREGYFEYLIDLADELKAANITWNNTVFLLKSSIDQLEQLTNRLKTFEQNIHYSLLDYRGNGKNILNEFITEEDKSRLPEFIFNTNLFNRNRPEYEWINLIEKNEAPKLTKRMLFLVATPDNIDHYIQMSVEEILHMFYDIDNNLQKSIPSIKFLADTYGNKKSTLLLDFRSVLWKWTDIYFQDNPKLDEALLFSDLHTSVMWR